MHKNGKKERLFYAKMDFSSGFSPDRYTQVELEFIMFKDSAGLKYPV